MSSSRIYNELDDKQNRNLPKKSNVYDKEIATCEKNISNAGSDKWSTDKERFLDSSKTTEFVKMQCTEKNFDMLKNLNVAASGKSKVEKEDLSVGRPKPGAVVIKESYIEPPKMTRISRSFHGNSPSSNSLADISNAPRRASEGVPISSRSLNQKPKNTNSEVDKNPPTKPQYFTQISQPSSASRTHEDYRKTSLTETVCAPRNPRFTTTLVDEAEHAASVGLARAKIGKNEIVGECEGAKGSFYVGDDVDNKLRKDGG